MTKKQYFWLAVVVTVIGIAFLVWGGIIYRNYDGMKEARIVMRHATWHAGLQYLTGLVCIIWGYIFIRKA